MRERDGQAERAPVGAAGDVEQLAASVEHHLLVEIRLVGAHAGAGLGDAVHRVIPVRTVLRVLPVRGPAEIGGVDVGGQPLLEAVELVGAAEMHLAGQDGAIAGQPQVVREGRRLRGELGRVVIGADRRGQPAGEEHRARRRAERGVAIGGIEHDGPIGERVDRRRASDPVAIGGQRAGSELVGHKDQDVRLACHQRCAAAQFAA